MSDKLRKLIPEGSAVHASILFDIKDYGPDLRFKLAGAKAAEIDSSDDTQRKIGIVSFPEEGIALVLTVNTHGQVRASLYMPFDSQEV